MLSIDGDRGYSATVGCGSTSGLDLESVGQIPAAKLMQRLKQTRIIPILTGYRIYLLGVDPNGKSPQYFESLKDFWFKFFNEADAEVRAFAIDRTLPAF